METKKMDDESGQEKEIDVEEQEEVDDEKHGKTTDEPEDCIKLCVLIQLYC